MEAKNLDIQGCIELGEAIVAQAGKDYIEVKKDIHILERALKKKQRELEDLEKFFKSNLYKLYTEVDGDKFKDLLDARFEEMRKSGKL